MHEKSSKLAAKAPGFSSPGSPRLAVSVAPRTTGVRLNEVERASIARHLYVHVDVDVLDPTEFGGLNMPEPGGLRITELVDALDSLRGFDVVGAGVTECVGSRDEVEVLAPVITKLGKLLSPRPTRG